MQKIKKKNKKGTRMSQENSGEKNFYIKKQRGRKKEEKNME